jgi:hypothetical protein
LRAAIAPVAIDHGGFALEHAVKKWNPVFHKKACDNNKIRACCEKVESGFSQKSMR